MIARALPQRAWRHLGLLTLLGVAPLVLHGVVAQAASLTAYAERANPYIVPAHAGLLYVLVPLAAIAAGVLFLTPGLLLAVALGRTDSAGVWVTTAMGLSLLVVSASVGLATALAGGPVTGAAFAALVLLLAMGCAIAALWRVARGRVSWPQFSREDCATILLMFALAASVYLLMSPKFLWENFNGDGAHAFESSRLLVRHALPFWPNSAGPVADFPGVTSMLFAFPNAWYLRLFGESEASVRLPFLLYLAVLFGALISLGQAGRGPASPRRQVAVALGLLAYAFAMAYSATYNPYSADLALPSTQDTLLMVCFVGALQAFVRRDWRWFTFFSALTYISLPNGLILIGFLLVAHVLVTRQARWSDAGRIAGVLLGCVVAGAVFSRATVALGGPPPGGEYGLVRILRYFAFLQYSDWTRLLFVAVPAGLLPALMLGWWRRQDEAARTVTLVTLAYFLFFFVQAHVSLHHFVPAMILPVAVALRTVPTEHAVESGWTWGWMAAAALAVGLSLPQRFGVHNDGRHVGRTILERVGDYEASDPDVFRASTLLDHLFPYDWDPAVPFAAYGGSPLVWNHYAQRDVPETSVNFVLQRASAPAPEGMQLLASDTSAYLYVRDEDLWRRQRNLRPATPAGALIYRIPRYILFHSVPATAGPRIIDVVATIESMGIDMTPLLTRLGVRR